LRALGIRQRGLHCTKDTFVTMALQLNAKIAWLEAHTGVSYATLRKHYGRWLPSGDEMELRRFQEAAPHLFEGPSVSVVEGDRTHRRAKR
jgi:hypothetical protein